MAAKTDQPAVESGGLGEAVKTVAQALVLAFLIRTFLFQPFNIPSGSMENTLLIGDYLFVSKFSYGFSRYSFPFGGLPISGRLFARQPQRGDIVVFKLPSNPSIDYVKRLVGLPGDRIQVKAGVLFINGEAVKRERLPDTVADDGRGGDNVSIRYQETLSNGVSYETLALDPSGPANNTGIFDVPSGDYFMMGDNRDNSADSRFPAGPGQPGVGYVPFDNLEGKAVITFFSVKSDQPVWAFWAWPWTVRWDRLLHLL